MCSVNPKLGIEHRLSTLIREPGPSKRVAVVGGGPAGMKAAIDLCDRGHKVVLFEASGHLGGAIHHANYVDFKWTLRDFEHYLIHQVEKRDIEVRLNIRAVPELVAAEGFDVVIAALGAEPAKPPIPGIDGENVCFAMEALLHPEALGKNVVVIGGGEAGVECGMNLAKKGHEVTVLEMRPMLAMDSTMIHFRSMFEEAWKAIPNFHGITNTRVTGITAEGVAYVDEAGTEQVLPAASVVISAGMKAKREEALAFYNAADGFELIGDCRTPATVQQAMHAAFAAASQI